MVFSAFDVKNKHIGPAGKCSGAGRRGNFGTISTFNCQPYLFPWNYSDFLQVVGPRKVLLRQRSLYYVVADEIIGSSRSEISVATG